MTCLATNGDSLVLPLLDKHALLLKGLYFLLFPIRAHGFIIIPSAAPAWARYLEQTTSETTVLNR